MAETNGQAWIESLGGHSLGEARALPAATVEKAQRNPGAQRFWPPVDGYVLTADQVQLYKAGKFNDTPILVGDVSDEAAAFGKRTLDPATFETEVRKDYGSHADAILAAYGHADEAKATRSATHPAGPQSDVSRRISSGTASAASCSAVSKRLSRWPGSTLATPRQYLAPRHVTYARGAPGLSVLGSTLRPGCHPRTAYRGGEQ